MNFSIVTPTWNRSELVDALLQSLFDERQRYSQGEALFVCGSRRMRIRVIVTQEELDSFGTGGGL